MKLSWHDDVRDVLTLDGETLVLTRSQLFRLGSIGAAVFLQLEDGCQIESVTESVRDEFGEPPAGSASEVVERMVSEMIEQGILQVVG